MTEYRLISSPRADLEIEAVFEWYERERVGLGAEFLGELRAAYDRISQGPFKYRALRSETRRALLRRFPYAVYFTVEDERALLVVAVLHASRDPGEWHGRRR